MWTSSCQWFDQLKTCLAFKLLWLGCRCSVCQWRSHAGRLLPITDRDGAKLNGLVQFIWNPYEAYSRYTSLSMPGIYHVYVGPLYSMHGIYCVYAKYIKILFLRISWSFNVVNPCYCWGQSSNVEHRTSQHSIILRESNATWFHGIYLTYTLYIPCICMVYSTIFSNLSFSSWHT